MSKKTDHKDSVEIDAEPREATMPPDEPSIHSTPAAAPGITEKIPPRAGFRTVKKLTKPLFSIAHRAEMLLKMEGEIYTIKLPIAGKKVEDTDTFVVDATDVDTGELGMLICNALIKSALDRAIPPLKDRFFLIRRGEIREGKRYRHIDVSEIAPNEDFN